MPINDSYDEQEMIKAVADALEEFYATLIRNLDSISIQKVFKRKNPYLFKAKGISEASKIIEAILSAFVSSSEETIFGNIFFEPIATIAAKGRKAIAEGIDITIEDDTSIYAIAVKSGPSVFNSSSRKAQERNFNAAHRLALQVKKQFVPIIGYGYGKKKTTKRGNPKIYQELAGQDFWYELTGDEQFYIKLIKYMDHIPKEYIENFNNSYVKASNRLLKEFMELFCHEDGSIDWEGLLEFNSGSK